MFSLYTAYIVLNTIADRQLKHITPAAFSHVNLLVCDVSPGYHVQINVDEHFGVTMNAISYTAARANLANTMANVCNDHAPIIISRKSEAPVVMMFLEYYNAMQETT